MNLSQFRRRLDAQGPDLAHWGAAERAAAERLVAADPAAQEALRAAQALDALLARVVDDAGEPMPGRNSAGSAEARLLARLERPLPSQRRTFLAGLWPILLLDREFAPSWRRIGALTSAAALGLVAGLLIADPARENDRASRGVADIGPFALAFDPEPLTGARP